MKLKNCDLGVRVKHKLDGEECVIIDVADDPQLAFTVRVLVTSGEDRGVNYWISHHDLKRIK